MWDENFMDTLPYTVHFLKQQTGTPYRDVELERITKETGILCNIPFTLSLSVLTSSEHVRKRKIVLVRQGGI